MYYATDVLCKSIKMEVTLKHLSHTYLFTCTGHTVPVDVRGQAVEASALLACGSQGQNWGGWGRWRQLL